MQLKTEEVEILPATQKNLYSITAMTKSFFPYTGFTFETILKRMDRKNIYYFVAILEGHTVGFVGNAKILGLAVLKELQGKGIGRKLLKKALDFAREKNCPNVFLFVADDNAIAQKLYGEFGFQKKGVLEKQLGGKTVWIYDKTLQTT
jgi:ribosomal-protein-alanine N-acetyltransferase